jgi:hypothetical protein
MSNTNALFTIFRSARAAAPPPTPAPLPTPPTSTLLDPAPPTKKSTPAPASELKSSVFGYYDLDYKISEDQDQDMDTQDSVRIMCDKEGNLIDANMIIRGKTFKPNQSADDVLSLVNGTPSDGHDASSRLVEVDKALDTTWFEEHYTIYTDKGSVTFVALYDNADEEDELGLEFVTNVSQVEYELDRPGTGIFKDVKKAVIDYDNDKSSDFNVNKYRKFRQITLHYDGEEPKL